MDASTNRQRPNARRIPSYLKLFDARPDGLREPRRPEADGPLDVELSDLPGVGPDALGLVRSVTVRGHRFVRAPERDWDGEGG